MILKRPLLEAVEIFLSTISKVSDSSSAFGFTVETDVVVESHSNSSFYRIKDINNMSASAIGLVLGNKITEKLEIGKKYKIFGSLKLTIAKSSGVFVNLVADAIEPLEEVPVQSASVLDLIKRYPIQSRKFPDKEILNIFMVCPSKDDAEATVDIESAIRSYRLEGSIILTKKQCQITDAKSVAKAIREAPDSADMLIIARGGGKKFPIQMLDDELIATALNNNSCYKVIGTGHASDRLAIEMLFDYVAAVPRDIVAHISSELKQRNELYDLRYKVASSNLAEKESSIGKLKQDNSILQKEANDYKIKYFDLLDIANSHEKEMYQLQHQIQKISSDDARQKDETNGKLRYYKIGMVVSIVVAVFVCYLHFV